MGPSPCVLVRSAADSPKRARLESIRYVLASLPYAGKDLADVDPCPDPDIVVRFHRSGARIY